MRRQFLRGAAAILLALPLTTAALAQGSATGIEGALSAPTRSPESRARDKYRHPAETLAFFGLKPGMTVLEISPGAGWYTEILAPAVGQSGKLVLLGPNPAASAGQAASSERLNAKLASSAEYRNTSVVPFVQGRYDFVPEGSMDMVVTFRNVHNWMGGGYAQEMFNGFARALKKGGVLGIEEHRLPEGRSQDPKAGSGYVKESLVIAMAEKAGLKLAARSEVNANPKDSADWPKGVWTLPPNYAEGPESKPKYEAIGESDRMTLRFVKP